MNSTKNCQKKTEIKKTDKKRNRESKQTKEQLSTNRKAN